MERETYINLANQFLGDDVNEGKEALAFIKAFVKKKPKKASKEELAFIKSFVKKKEKPKGVSPEELAFVKSFVKEEEQIEEARYIVKIGKDKDFMAYDSALKTAYSFHPTKEKAKKVVDKLNKEIDKILK